MLACRITYALIIVFGWAMTPLRLVTQTLGGCLVSCTFGLLLLPLSLVWMVLLGLLLATSWLWERTEVLRVPVLVSLVRIPIAIIGIPLAALSATYSLLIPTMGETESLEPKLGVCATWPFSVDYWRFYVCRVPVESADAERRYQQLQEAAGIGGVVLSPLTERATHVPYEERLREDSEEEEQPPVEEEAPEAAEEEQPSATTPAAPPQPRGPMCPNCGYHDDGGRTSCPSCGFPLAPP